MALRKFAAARIAEGVSPAGGVNSRFSTWPSAVTSTTSARSGAERDELDVPDRRLGLRREHQARAVGQAGEHVAGAVEDRG